MEKNYFRLLFYLPSMSAYQIDYPVSPPYCFKKVCNFTLDIFCNYYHLYVRSQHVNEKYEKYLMLPAIC